MQYIEYHPNDSYDWLVDEKLGGYHFWCGCKDFIHYETCERHYKETSERYANHISWYLKNKGHKGPTTRSFFK